jgi:hypothetical protein
MRARQASAQKDRDADITPMNRRAIRERAETAALAEVESVARQRREKSERLRRLRLAQDED